MGFVGFVDGNGLAQSDIIPDAMPRHDEHFSVAFTLPRLRDLFLRELKGAGIAHGLDICLPSDASPEAYERLAIEVEKRFRDVHEPSSSELAAQPPVESAERSSSPALAAPPSEESAERSSSPALAAQPPEESTERSKAARCFFLAKAFLEACECERYLVVAEIETDLMVYQNEGDEFYRLVRSGRERLQSAIHALEIAPFPLKDLEPLIGEMKVQLAVVQSLPLPPEAPVYTAPLLRQKVFEECRNRIAAFLAKTGLPPEDIGPAFYENYDQDPARAWGRFKRWCCEARKKML